MVYPKGDRTEANDYMSVFVYLESNLPNYCAYELSIVDKSGAEKQTRSLNKIFGKTSFAWGWSKFISRSDLFEKEKELIKDNTLTISGKFEFINESKFELEKAKAIDSERLEQFFKGRNFTDLEIKIQGRSIKTHKVLLAASSRVLAIRLFDLAQKQSAGVANACGAKKKKKNKNKKGAGSKKSESFECVKQTRNLPMANVLEIDDLEFGVAVEMINFIHDGKVSDMRIFAKPLLEAAEKFKINRLKIFCEKYLFENLNPDNVIETLKFSGKCRAVELKNECFDFIQK
jgi:speckle-type POZ protein